MVLMQNTQADLTHQLFDVHLPPPVRIVEHINCRCHLASDLVFKLKASGRF
jgi:hypothetical protein